MKINIDHCRSEESERLQDSNENAVQRPNETLKLSGKANSKHKQVDNEIKEIYESNHNKYYMAIYCKDLKSYLSFISL